MRAHLSIELRRTAGGRVAARGDLAVAPFWCRWDGTTLWMVGSAATPVATDDVAVDLEVGDGVHAMVRTVAASVVYAGTGAGTRLRTTARVGAGAVLRWQPEPVIVTERARHRSSTTIDVAPSGAVLWDELVVMGRTQERPGAYSASLHLRGDGATWCRTAFDTSTPGWDGPGGTSGAKVVGTRVVVDHRSPDRADPTPGPHTVVLRPEAGGRIATTVAEDPAGALAQLDDAVQLDDARASGPAGSADQAEGPSVVLGDAALV